VSKLNTPREFDGRELSSCSSLSRSSRTIDGFLASIAPALVLNFSGRTSLSLSDEFGMCETVSLSESLASTTFFFFFFGVELGVVVALDPVAVVEEGGVGSLVGAEAGAGA
jgi:hypothetical protein